MKKYLVFVYIIALLAVTTLIAQAGGMWQEVAYSGGAAQSSQGTTFLVNAVR